MFRRQPPTFAPVSFTGLPSVLLSLLARRYDGGELETRLQRHFGVDRVCLTDSGTAALTLAMARARTRRDLPIAIPAYACYDLATAAVGSGSPLRFYDLDPDTLAPDRASLHRAIESGVSAVVIVHLFGVPVDIPSLTRELGSTPVIEDAAQGVGGTLNGRPLGSFGPMGVLSFGRGKGMTGGRGGALLIDDGSDPDPTDSLQPANLRSGWKEVATATAVAILSRPQLFWIPASLPFLRLGETIYRTPRTPGAMSRGAAALLQTSWPLADAETARRRENAARLERRLPGRRLASVRVPRDAQAGNLRLPVVARDRAIRDRAVAAGSHLGISSGYPSPLPSLPALGKLGLNRNEPFPGAAALACGLITLPVHSLLSSGDLERLEGWIAEWG